MGKEINFFAEDPGRYERFQQEFRAQHIIEDVLDEILARHRDALKEREGEERDLSRLIGGLCFGKAHKTFQAIIRLCALGLGEDAAILLRSNINLLINVYFILKDTDPIERCNEFVDYSLSERMRYIDDAHEGKFPEWMKKISIENKKRIKDRARKWSKNRIKDRAKKMDDSSYLLHYRQGYQLYSSLEHADVMALSGYVHDENGTNLRISSGPSDDYIGVVLVHNYAVMADLLVAVMNYYGIQRADLVEKLHRVWRALDQDAGASFVT